ncbi:uncharacterized protein LOC124363567 [Homalodisca vitripennis]|uniref:uncharacterized protein LOC124363567 n=1 Tax=Homalodisca vitripennis TaxID=197043 RepID=UPI001EEA328C|nr:uncharacterized protein LOC124363567 [Homalodisca vitripennis]
MDFLILAVLCVGLVGSLPVPNYPLYSTYITPRYLHRPAVFAPLPPQQRTAPASPPQNPQDLVIHNMVKYVVNPEAEPEAAQHVVQYYSKDGLGRVVFGYVIPSETRFEALSNDGTVRGSYSYKDPTGKIVKMYYWDDGTGFHTMGNNLPRAFYSPPQYTPEVQVERDRHFQLYKDALNAAFASGSGDEIVEPQSQPNSPAESVCCSGRTRTRQQTTLRFMPDYDDDSDAVAIENADFSYLRQAHAFRGGEPEAARRQVAEVGISSAGICSKYNTNFYSGVNRGAGEYSCLQRPLPSPTDHLPAPLHGTTS